MQKDHLKKAQHLLMIKTLRIIVTGGNFITLTKVISEHLQPTPCTTAMASEDQTQSEGAHSPLQFSVILGVLASEPRQEKELKTMQLGK